MLITVLLPLVAALIGMLGGLLVARYQTHSSKELEAQKAAEAAKNARKSLALEIVKLEFEQARLDGRASSHSILAHWAVVAAMMEESRVSLDDPELDEVITHISTYYLGVCWGADSPTEIEEKQEELFGKWESIDEGMVDPMNVLQSAKEFLSEENVMLEMKGNKLDQVETQGQRE